MKNITIIIILLIVGAVSFTAGLSIKGIYDAMPANQKIADLENRLKFEVDAEMYAIRELIVAQKKLEVYESLDTNGISCSIITDALRKKYEGDLADAKLHTKMLSPVYDMMFEYTKKYYEVTKDSSVLDSLNKYHL